MKTTVWGWCNKGQVCGSLHVRTHWQNRTGAPGPDLPCRSMSTLSRKTGESGVSGARKSRRSLGATLGILGGRNETWDGKTETTDESTEHSTVELKARTPGAGHTEKTHRLMEGGGKPYGSVGSRPLGARWGWGRTEVVVEDAVGGVELEGAGEVAEGVGELAEGPEADPAAPVEGGVVVVDLRRRGGRGGEWRHGCRKENFLGAPKKKTGWRRVNRSVDVENRFGLAETVGMGWMMTGH